MGKNDVFLKIMTLNLRVDLETKPESITFVSLKLIYLIIPAYQFHGNSSL